MGDGDSAAFDVERYVVNNNVGLELSLCQDIYLNTVFGNNCQSHSKALHGRLNFAVCLNVNVVIYSGLNADMHGTVHPTIINDDVRLLPGRYIAVITEISACLVK